MPNPDVQSRETPRAMGAQNRQRHLEDAAVGLDEAVRALGGFLAAHAFYSERERALREALSQIRPLNVSGGEKETAVLDIIDAALVPTDPARPTTEGVGGDEKPTSELPAHIAQAQEDVRARGMCGAVYDDPVKGESMCIRDPHSGPHGWATEGAREPECNCQRLEGAKHSPDCSIFVRLMPCPVAHSGAEGCDVCDSTGWVPAEGAREGERDDRAAKALCMYRTGDPQGWERFRRDVEIVRANLQCTASDEQSKVPSDARSRQCAPGLNGPSGSPTRRAPEQAPEQLLDEAREPSDAMVKAGMEAEDAYDADCEERRRDRSQELYGHPGAAVQSCAPVQEDGVRAVLRAALAAASPNPMDGEG